ncbi:hypothetical protein CAAN1_16S03642 [[Candida] anglica]|uniref:Uncharacterized protein n=1 Tax=[Candida] anglica TaxID=148631 RepID=A0ABP0EAG4_9ASCO
MSVDSRSDNENLLAENACVLGMVPSLVQDLYYWETTLEMLYQVIKVNINDSELDSELKTYWESFYQSLNEQVEELSVVEKEKSMSKDMLAIDENKSIMLTFLLGTIFIKALEILSRQDSIVVKVHSNQSHEEKLVLVQEYMRGIFPQEIPISITVLHSENYEPNEKDLESFQKQKELKLIELKKLVETIEQQVPKLILSRDKLFSKLELNLKEPPSHVHEDELEDNEQEQPHEENKREYIVDLKSWYCSCNTYQLQHTGVPGSHPEHEQQYEPNSPNPNQYPISLTQLLSTQPYPTTLSNLLQASNVPTKHASLLPLCAHLLAVLIGAWNQPTITKRHNQTLSLHGRDPVQDHSNSSLYTVK